MGVNTYLVTGASGLIGSSIVDLLAARAGERVFAAVRNARSLSQRLDNKVQCVTYDALKPVALDFRVDVIVHAASPASPELFVEKPVETMMANVIGVKEML